MIRKNKLFELN